MSFLGFLAHLIVFLSFAACSAAYAKQNLISEKSVLHQYLENPYPGNDPLTAISNRTQRLKETLSDDDESGEKIYVGDVCFASGILFSSIEEAYAWLVKIRFDHRHELSVKNRDALNDLIKFLETSALLTSYSVCTSSQNDGFTPESKAKAIIELNEMVDEIREKSKTFESS